MTGHSAALMIALVCGFIAVGIGVFLDGKTTMIAGNVDALLVAVAAPATISVPPLAPNDALVKYAAGKP